MDVIYICPFELSEEMLQYYIKLLGLHSALRTGNPEDVADLQDRFKILTPEALRSFPVSLYLLITTACGNAIKLNWKFYNFQCSGTHQ